ncbi:urease accessory protein UreH [Candidatus Woesearchaeota archaeon]|jgi:ABC-type nickel/cobalt efflux system permease component RcnA|nr:urease accessory protein UreH [Candidatus Woesearchaeota archaeon]|tara:strand:- start:3918 stop:4610 length:693 start_codon:yes stop_codon:yes gene_type:complete
MGVAIITFLVFGFLLGVRHAFDSDHIAAMSTLIAKTKSLKKSTLLGILWGFGHTISLFIIGSLILLFKITIPEKIALSFELLAGIMLVILGFNIIFTLNKNKIHIHKHSHGNKEHHHFHSHKFNKNHSHEHLQASKSLLIGSVHGLAGSAALALLVLTTVNSTLMGLFYIIIFGVGSMLGMTLITASISLPIILLENKLNNFDRLIKLAAATFSLLIGALFIYNIGIQLL